jgi:hypothetical protein
MVLRTERSQVIFPVRSLDFCSWSNPSSRTIAVRSTQPPTEVSPRNISMCKGRSACKADV